MALTAQKVGENELEKSTAVTAIEEEYTKRITAMKKGFDERVKVAVKEKEALEKAMKLLSTQIQELQASKEGDITS